MEKFDFKQGAVSMALWLVGVTFFGAVTAACAYFSPVAVVAVGLPIMLVLLFFLFSLKGPY